MKIIAMTMAGATLAFAPAAMAQMAPQTAPQQPAAPQQNAPAPAPSATAAPATNASVTDAEVAQFATAALDIEKIRKDTTLAEADKGSKMAAAATAAGLTAERFNAIGQAMQSDPALNKRIQAAATAKMAATGSAPSATQP